MKDGSGICSYDEEVPIEVKEPVVINEINYRSSPSTDSGDWIELYNPSSAAINVSNWEVKDSDDAHVFEIPAGTQLQAFDYLVFVKDELKFTTVFPDIPYVGELGYGLGSPDAVRLYNSYGNLVDEVYYQSVAPWPVCADGTGSTLELITADLDNSLAESWNCININGSPNAINSLEPAVDPENSSLTLYPNPVQNILYITGDDSEDYDVEVFSVLGQLVLSVVNVTQIEVGGFNSGLYLIKITSENSTQVKRIVKF